MAERPSPRPVSLREFRAAQANVSPLCSQAICLPTSKPSSPVEYTGKPKKEDLTRMPSQYPDLYISDQDILVSILHSLIKIPLVSDVLFTYRKEEGKRPSLFIAVGYYWWILFLLPYMFWCEIIVKRRLKSKIPEHWFTITRYNPFLNYEETLKNEDDLLQWDLELRRDALSQETEMLETEMLEIEA